MLKQFNQVKMSSVRSRKVFDLFALFKLRTILRKSGIVKTKGHQVQEMLFFFLTIILEGRSSLYNGLIHNNITSMKTPINDMLNNPKYNWRKLLY